MAAGLPSFCNLPNVIGALHVSPAPQCDHVTSEFLHVVTGARFKDGAPACRQRGSSGSQLGADFFLPILHLRLGCVIQASERPGGTASRKSDPADR